MVIVLFFNILFGSLINDSCIPSIDNRDIYRNSYSYPETIQGEHFVVHFTTSDVDSQFVNNQWMNLQSNIGFAQSILELTEFALMQYLEDGWEIPPPDCDESIDDLDSPSHCSHFGGNPLYDIYIANDAAGMVVPETPYPVEPYIGGYTSYMKISTFLNAYDSLPNWAEHVIAHELHHAIQMRYGYSVSGSPGNYMFNGWFFEQTASYMENVIFPNSNHLYTMLANCNITTPLTFPELGIDYPGDLYQYRSALWQKYLVESIGDSSIVRYMWEDYGLQYGSGNIVSLFPIYENAIYIATENQVTLDEAFDEYSIWRYFTGSRNIQNNFFEESSGYCTSSTFNIGGTYSLWTNAGGAYFIDLPQGEIDLVISSNSTNNINCLHLTINSNNEIAIEDIFLDSNDNYINFDSVDNGSQVLLLNTNYDNTITSQVNFTIEENLINLLGDLNYDGDVNVVDVVILVNFALLISTPNANQFISADINDDNSINVIDVVQLINIILSDVIIEKINDSNGYSYECYPKADNMFPVVLYNHGGLGESVGGDLLNTCFSLAQNGYLAKSEKREETISLEGHLDEVMSSLNHLKNHEKADGERIGVVGFSRGGLLSLEASILDEEIDSIVLLAPALGNGLVYNLFDEFGSINSSVQIHISENDASPDNLVDLSYDIYNTLLNNGVNAEIIQHPAYDSNGNGIIDENDDGHQLFFIIQDSYWNEVLIFLNQTL